MKSPNASAQASMHSSNRTLSSTKIISNNSNNNNNNSYSSHGSKTLLAVVKLQISESETGVLKVYQGDDVIKLAQTFCVTHDLQDDCVAHMVKHITQQINQAQAKVTEKQTKQQQQQDEIVKKVDRLNKQQQQKQQYETSSIQTSEGKEEEEVQSLTTNSSSQQNYSHQFMFHPTSENGKIKLDKTAQKDKLQQQQQQQQQIETLQINQRIQGQQQQLEPSRKGHEWEIQENYEKWQRLISAKQSQQQQQIQQQQQQKQNLIQLDDRKKRHSEYSAAAVPSPIITQQKINREQQLELLERSYQTSNSEMNQHPRKGMVIAETTTKSKTINNTKQSKNSKLSQDRQQLQADSLAATWLLQKIEETQDSSLEHTQQDLTLSRISNPSTSSPSTSAIANKNNNFLIPPLNMQAIRSKSNNNSQLNHNNRSFTTNNQHLMSIPHSGSQSHRTNRPDTNTSYNQISERTNHKDSSHSFNDHNNTDRSHYQTSISRRSQVIKEASPMRQRTNSQIANESKQTKNQEINKISSNRRRSQTPSGMTSSIRNKSNIEKESNMIRSKRNKEELQQEQQQYDDILLSQGSNSNDQQQIVLSVDLEKIALRKKQKDRILVVQEEQGQERMAQYPKESIFQKQEQQYLIQSPQQQQDQYLNKGDNQYYNYQQEANTNEPLVSRLLREKDTSKIAKAEGLVMMPQQPQQSSSSLFMIYLQCEIFNAMDSNGDGVISVMDVNIERFPTEILAILQEYLFHLADHPQERYTFQTFFQYLLQNQHTYQALLEQFGKIKKEGKTKETQNNNNNNQRFNNESDNYNSKMIVGSFEKHINNNSSNNNKIEQFQPQQLQKQQQQQGLKLHHEFSFSPLPVSVGSASRFDQNQQNSNHHLTEQSPQQQQNYNHMDFVNFSFSQEQQQFHQQSFTQRSQSPEHSFEQTNPNLGFNNNTNNPSQSPNSSPRLQQQQQLSPDTNHANPSNLFISFSNQHFSPDMNNEQRQQQYNHHHQQQSFGAQDFEEIAQKPQIQHLQFQQPFPAIASGKYKNLVKKQNNQPFS